MFLPFACPLASMSSIIGLKANLIMSMPIDYQGSIWLLVKSTKCCNISFTTEPHISVLREGPIYSEYWLIESSKFCFSLWACCGWTCCSSRSSQTPPSRCPRPRLCQLRPWIPSWILINYFNTKGQSWNQGTYWLTWHPRHKQWEGLHLLLSQQAWFEWIMQIYRRKTRISPFVFWYFKYYWFGAHIQMIWVGGIPWSVE